MFFKKKDKVKVSKGYKLEVIFVLWHQQNRVYILTDTKKQVVVKEKERILGQYRNTKLNDLEVGCEDRSAVIPKSEIIQILFDITEIFE